MNKASLPSKQPVPPTAATLVDDDPWAQLLARNETLDEFVTFAVDAPDGDEPRTEKPGALWEIKSEADFLKLEELLAYIRSL